MLELFPDGFAEVDGADATELVAFTDEAGAERFRARFENVRVETVPEAPAGGSAVATMPRSGPGWRATWATLRNLAPFQGAGHFVTRNPGVSLRSTPGYGLASLRDECRRLPGFRGRLANLLAAPWRGAVS